MQTTHKVPFLYLVDDGVEDDRKNTKKYGAEEDQDGAHPRHHFYLRHRQHNEGTRCNV